MYPLHKNDEGSFQELAHASDVEFGQLSVLIINPNSIRGGHYHTRKKEWFCCLHGKCKMEINNIKDGSKKMYLIEGFKREFVLIEPYESHNVINITDREICELLVISSEIYNEKDPDTFKHEEDYKC